MLTGTGAVPELRSPRVPPQAEQGRSWGVTTAQPPTMGSTNPSRWAAGPRARAPAAAARTTQVPQHKVKKKTSIPSLSPE